MASSLLGGFFAPIISYNEFIQAKSIVGYICLVVELLASAAMAYACFGIYKNRDNWIKEKRRSTVILIKIIVLWILGILQCLLYVMYGILHMHCGGKMYLLLSQKGVTYCFVYIAYTFLQMGFITFCNHFIFFDVWKIRYIISLLTISNMVKWLEANVFSIFVKTRSDISVYYDVMQNCSYITENHLDNIFQLTDMLLPPFLMEFSILAASLIIGLSLSKVSKNSREIEQIEYVGDIQRGQFNITPLPLRIKLIMTVVAVTLNVPFLFYGITFAVNIKILEDFIHPWIISILVAKVIVFLLILGAFYMLNKRMDIHIENRRLNCNGVALILCSSAVSLTGVVNNLFPMGKNLTLITFHTWFNVFYIIYQTIFILFGTSIVFKRGDHRVMLAFRAILIILISYNLLYWIKDSLFFQRSIENDTRDNFIRLLFFVLYPFLSFYRFQSAMELIPVYCNVCLAY